MQPDFQRGEVWTTGKKQRLIDSILRGWHVPPIHLVAKGDGKFDVLDGQQRLTAIRDFTANEFAVDARIEPERAEIKALDGMRWNTLPETVKDQFESFPIRVFELHDYTSEEPHELFFRLNQPTNLTEAEKRNAFIGGARNQVKEIVEWAKKEGMTAERIGFSNARMAYDDLVARFLLTIEQRTLLEKVTAARITNRYRRSEQFDSEVIDSAQSALSFFLGLGVLDKDNYKDIRPKPNKATIHTWLCLAASLHRTGKLEELDAELGATVEAVEQGRISRSLRTGPQAIPLTVFNDRATSRVADVSSVVLRDLCAWMMLTNRLDSEMRGVFKASVLADSAWSLINEKPEEPETALSEFSVSSNWGEAPWL